MAEARVTVTLTPLELKLLRRAVAKAVDQGQMAWGAGLKRVGQLMALERKTQPAGAGRAAGPRKAAR